MTLLAKLHRLKPFAAPRRPIFEDPDTGRKISGKTRTELIQKIVTYRAQNELPPIENLDLVLQNYWATLPENKHLREEVTLERGFLTYLKGGITLIKTVLFDEFTTQEEADRRALLCLECPHNIEVEKPEFMQWADEITEHSIGDRRSKYHDKLGNCAVCTCVLKAKVWYGGKLELSKEEEIQTPKFCWQRKENQK